VISPSDSLELIPVLKRAQDAGIVVINIDNRLDIEFSESAGLANVPFISVNNEMAAYQSAKYISDQITSPTQAVILEGIRSAKNAEDRKNGAMQAFYENENIDLVAMETAHWKIDEGYEVTKELFANYPNIGAIFAANDMMALGAIQYIHEIGKTNDVSIASFDALKEAREAIKEGTLDVTIDQLAAEQGYLGVEYAIHMLNGEDLPVETFIDFMMVTRENVE
jgi:ribose transport system substrate-binding protein